MTSHIYGRNTIAILYRSRPSYCACS